MTLHDMEEHLMNDDSWILGAFALFFGMMFLALYISVHI